ncbi:MAG: transposase [Gammaproteobacteria bacterium]|nr:transposase [Gammaproteobacteria bacterium]
MARLPRYNLPGQPQHVILRGNNRSIIFVSDEDYRYFKECLKDAADRHGCAIHAYVLMTNHVHLLVTPEREDGIGKVIQSVGRRYVQYFNYLQKRTGTLWEGRYKSTLIDSERYLLICSRYIELNPVRAQIVAHPRHYAWSSYRHHAEGKEDLLVTDHALYLALGKKPEVRQLAYRALFKAHIDERTLQDIRDATNKGWALGGERFLEEITAAANRRATPLPKGRPKQEVAESE